MSSIQTAIETISDSAKISASQDDFVTLFCFYDFHNIGPRPKVRYNHVAVYDLSLQLLYHSICVEAAAPYAVSSKLFHERQLRRFVVQVGDRDPRRERISELSSAFTDRTLRQYRRVFHAFQTPNVLVAEDDLPR